jgi:hypothetical protein
MRAPEGGLSSRSPRTSSGSPPLLPARSRIRTEAGAGQAREARGPSRGPPVRASEVTSEHLRARHTPQMTPEQVQNVFRAQYRPFFRGRRRPTPTVAREQAHLREAYGWRWARGGCIPVRASLPVGGGRAGVVRRRDCCRPLGRRSSALAAAARLARVRSASTIEDSEDVTWHIC